MARRVFAALALTVLVAGLRLRSRRRRTTTAKETATPAATVAAKPDISKAGDVTLTVWDQEVRGGQNASRSSSSTRSSMAKYPNVKIERVAKSFEDLLKTVKLAASGPETRPTSCRPTRAARSWASWSRPS